MPESFRFKTGLKITAQFFTSKKDRIGTKNFKFVLAFSVLNVSNVSLVNFSPDSGIMMMMRV